MYLIFGLGFVAFLIAFLVTPFVRDTFRRFGLVDRPDGARKRHASAVPRVGGIAIAIAYVGAFAIVLSLPFSYNSEVLKALPGVWKLFCAALIIFATGLFDDLVNYAAWQKLFGQIWAAVIAYLAGVQIQILPHHPLQALWNFPLTLIWLVGCSNAFNLIDGLDGLAAGIGLFATTTTLIAAFANDNLDLALVTIPLAGALLGFLRYNFNPASIFLGDSGSLLVGFLLGCFGVLWSQKSATMVGMTAPMIALAIPLLDVAVSVVRRFLRHQPIFSPDRGHIHHMLLAKGLTVRRSALLLYAVCGVAAAFSLVQDALQNEFAGLIIVLFCVGAWVGIQHLGYVEFAAARQMFAKGAFRRIIGFQSRLQEFETVLSHAASIEECWPAIVKASGEFGFHRVRMMAHGEIFEKVVGAGDGPIWQVRIPLQDGQYVNLERGASGGALNAIMVDGLVTTLEKTLTKKLAGCGQASAVVREERAHPASEIDAEVVGATSGGSS